MRCSVLIVSLVLLSDYVYSEEHGRLVEHVDVTTGAKWLSSEVANRFKGENMLCHLGALPEPPEQRQKTPTISHQIRDDELPRQFDAREHWPNCPTIKEIRDQSSCGSCWAFGATEAMSDRLCIHSNGTVQKRVGATDLLSCCHLCGFGCHGGRPIMAWLFWAVKGIATGGSMENQTGCRSYPFPRCEHHAAGKYPECPHSIFHTPACKKVCDDPQLDYTAEKTRGKFPYLVREDEQQIMKEIMTNGPVEAAFSVYEDFTTYKSGVYFHSSGRLLGGHAIRLLGWGEDPQGVPYWLLANSWNDDWGENGFFRILRGKNECGIESQIVAGLPKF